jgi:hypothetical protein
MAYNSSWKYSKENENKDVSVFNMSLASLIRIDNILTACAIACSQRNLSKWYSCLVTLSLQVDYDFEMKEEEDSEYQINKKLFNKICELQSKYEKFERKEILNKFEKFSEYFMTLKNYERFIRKALDTRGMLMKMDDWGYDDET